MEGSKKRLIIWIVLVFIIGLVFQLDTGKILAQEDLPELEEDSSGSGSGGGNEMDELEKVIEQEEKRDVAQNKKKYGKPKKASKVEDNADAGIEDDLSEVDEKGISGGEGEGVDGNMLGLPSEDEINGGEVAENDAKKNNDGKESSGGEVESGEEGVDLELGSLPDTEFTEQGEESEPDERSLALDPGTQNEILNLEFKMEGAGSRIVVTSRNPLRYREVKNSQMKQVVYFFENTVSSERVQRAYDTTEFPSPVALFTLLQVPNETPPVSKLIVQLREEQESSVVPTEKGLFIDFGAPKDTSEARIVYGKEEESDIPNEENIYSGDKRYTGRLIQRLEIKDSDVQDVLRLIAKTSGYNIVVGDDVQGKVGTLSLENIPWDQAFTLILQSKKLGYVRQGNVLRVATLQTLQSEKGEAMANERARMQVEPLKTIMFPVSYAKAEDLAKKGKAFMSERGSIDTDERTNTIIVKDVRKTITQVQKLFSALDTQPPRVSIGAKFVEISSSFTRDLGFALNVPNASFAGVNMSHNYGFNQSGSVTTVLSAPDFGNLTATLKMGETEEKVRTLANPTVSVVANQKASVTQAQSRFCSMLVITAGGNTAPTFQKITANLNLEVTPIVAGDGTIFLTMKVTNEIPTGTECANMSVDSRDVNTQVLLENGDTAVVGSIFKSTITDNSSYFPLLGRVPILGFFFSGNNFSDLRSEIFVFVTAKIMNADESFKRTI